MSKQIRGTGPTRMADPILHDLKWVKHAWELNSLGGAGCGARDRFHGTSMGLAFASHTSNLRSTAGSVQGPALTPRLPDQGQTSCRPAGVAGRWWLQTG